MKKNNFQKLNIPITLSMLFLLLVVAGCNNKKNTNDSSYGSNIQTKSSLNVTILLDLSDRIIRDNVTPSQMENDIAIVNYLVDKFKEHAVKNGKLAASKDHLKVMFYPTPRVPQIQNVSRNLDVNLAKLPPAEKKKVLMGMDTMFSDGLGLLYRQTLNEKKWVGCDIWGFFSNKKVDNFCVSDSARNILIIITDGYLFHKDNKVKIDNNYSYFTPEQLSSNPNAELIVKRDGLENLEVLFLEINDYHQQEEMLVTKLGRWLECMGVQKYQVVPTDMTNNIEEVIDQFIGY